MTSIPVQSVREQMIALLTTRFGLEEASVSPDMTFGSMELDSLAIVEFSVALQEDFGVPVGEDEVTAENTVDDVAALMIGKLTAQDPVG
ncbi:acyl carrier protein [Streptomyces viridosporus]|uniref:acyl carrier protein n=1 Tax=Streptomyces viridosporus TaxID=67581 RepID=UPI00342359B7